MATVNGTVGNTSKPVARLPSKPVVPVLPLNFPQRPANKKPSGPPASSSPKKGENGVRPAGKEKAGPQTLNSNQAPINGSSTELGIISKNNIDNTASSTRRAQAEAVIKTETNGLVSTLDGEKASPTVSTVVPDRRIVSPAHRRPPGFANPAPEIMATSGALPDGPVPAPHPVTINRPAAFHQPHLSNGSLILGPFHDSNASSPAPRSGGGVFHFPPGLLPYPPPALDAYGRPLLVSPAVDGFAPTVGNHHTPPTPHSFHGSQTSTQAEELGFNPYSVANGHAGPNGSASRQGPMPPPGMNPPMIGTAHHVPGSGPGYQGLRDQEEALAFLRHGISDNTFNDCVLEVRFSDSPEFQDHPGYRQLHSVLRTHGHRYIFSRSPMLAATMKTQGTMPGGVIFLEANDEYMRSDVFWYALRTLYGWSLADSILPHELALRDVRDDLKTALSYIATARYLQLPWVQSVAVHRASRLLFWNTIEVAVKFVSQVVAVSPRTDGFGVSELLDQVLTFIVHNFPADFILDLSAGDYGLPRLPPSSTTPSNQDNPTVANGTSVGLHSRQPSKTQAQMPRNPHVSSHVRLSQIKFGDISPSKNGRSARGPTPNDTILSRILLNLPFELLKQILEHPHLAKLSGELNPTARQSIITDIIGERESRRLRVLEKADSQLRFYQERVENATGPSVVGSMDDFWVNNMGFKEEVFPGDLPYLVHTWSQPIPSSVSS
ncbi:hypothetical protein N657DRAFT_653222 [Parathielavia appendiculata]|uniref:Uncharacterized protein n=1 Tax=Parathielavia appendiculata TaxID=2587402 RepID=A0AAN6U6B4_9PEZI|nr:hypothetical protein N657DRAFT_653222 [Parathielavia appendiculata]